MGLKIDIGCGPKNLPGYIGLDYEDFGQDIVRDLTKGLPFADNTVSEVSSTHSIEHFKIGEELWFLISEIWRVCHDGANITIRCPHSSVPQASDISHFSFWNESSCGVFDRTLSPYAAIPKRYKWDFDIVERKQYGCELHVKLKAKKPNVHAIPTTAKTAMIIVHYGDKKHTDRLLDSIHRFTDPAALRILVVDNSCKDYAFHADKKNVEFIHPPSNLGWVEGINLGMRRIIDTAKGEEFVIWSNNDCAVQQAGWLPRMLNHFTESTGAVGPTSNYVMGRQNTAFSHDGVWEEPIKFLIGFFLCLRMDVCRKIGALEDIHYFKTGSAHPSGADDLDYSIRIRQLGYELKIARDVYVWHTGSQALAGVLTAKEYNDLCLEANEALAEKWGKEIVSETLTPTMRIMISVPMRTDYLHEQFCFSFAEMRKPVYSEICNAPRGHPAVSRNRLVQFARDKKCSHILFLDDDHILHRDTFTRLFNINADVAAALAFQRNPDYLPCMYQWAGHEGQLCAIPIEGLIHCGIQRVDATGFAAVLIKMDVFDKIPEPWFEFKDLGEDLDFCRRCFDQDIQIFVDTDLILPHIGASMVIDENTFYEHKRKG